MAEMAQSIILYKHSEAWSLPSLSAASIQVEAYLRFTGQPFHAKACASNSKSPTGGILVMLQKLQDAGLSIHAWLH